MDLIAGELKRSWRKRFRASIGGKWIGSAAPGQVFVGILPELPTKQCPVNPLGRPAERRHRHPLQAEAGIAGGLIPDQCHLPVQRIGIPVERSLANLRYEANDDRIVDILGPNTLGACVPTKA